MPPPSNDRALDLQLLPRLYSVTQLRPDEEIPDPIIERLKRNDGRFISVTRTTDEISVVAEAEEEQEAAEWRCIKINGPMDFGLTGIMSDLVYPLKKAKISIFALSTWNTDYVLVKKEVADAAVRVLREDGWNFVPKA